MKRLIFLSLSFFLSLSASEDLNQMLEKRFALYKELSVSRKEWREERRALEGQVQIFQQKEAQLKKDLAELKSDVEEEEQAFQKLSKTLRQSQDFLSSFEIQVDKDLSSLTEEFKRLPHSLQILIPAMKDLEEMSKGSLLKKLRLLEQIQNDFFHLQKGLNKTREKVTINGEKREVNVLYLGTAVGYYLSLDSKSAGVISYQKGSWITEARNELAPEIQKARQILAQEESPALLKLPLGGKK